MTEATLPPRSQTSFSNFIITSRQNVESANDELIINKFY